MGEVAAAPRIHWRPSSSLGRASQGLGSPRAHTCRLAQQIHTRKWYFVPFRVKPFVVTCYPAMKLSFSLIMNMEKKRQKESKLVPSALPLPAAGTYPALP